MEFGDIFFVDFRRKQSYNFPKGGHEMEYFTQYDSPVGTLLLTSDGESLTGLWMDREAPAQGIEDAGHLVLRRAGEWLDTYFAGENPALDIPMSPRGTPFQQMVWKILLTIPFGQTRTYGDIAREVAALLGKEKMSAQAVGGAVGSNPISILIPCHRVVGAKGQLTGYAWGLERKAWLLRHEGWEGL